MRIPAKFMDLTLGRRTLTICGLRFRTEEHKDDLTMLQHLVKTQERAAICFSVGVGPRRDEFRPGGILRWPDCTAPEEGDRERAGGRYVVVEDERLSSRMAEDDDDGHGFKDPLYDALRGAGFTSPSFTHHVDMNKFYDSGALPYHQRRRKPKRNIVCSLRSTLTN